MINLSDSWSDRGPSFEHRDTKILCGGADQAIGQPTGLEYRQRNLALQRHLCCA
jgi:hypothetical protein